MAEDHSMDTPEYIPRKYARKDSYEALGNAIKLSLDYEQDAVRRNTNAFNTGRYQATGKIPDYESLKDRARAIKEDAIRRLPELLDTLRSSVEQNGGTVYLARDAEDATRHISELCTGYNAELVVKAKSMTSEEIHLNSVLESAGMEVVETDLGEMIIQLADEQPSHIVGPAIHRNREQISTLFKEHFETNQSLDSGEELTKFARDLLRKKFIRADIGISGANAIAADSGTLLLVESEGNIRMVSQAPPVHIAIAGIEKIVPSKADLFPLLELLGPSGTGQPLTSYTNLITPPLNLRPFSFNHNPPDTRSFHLVLLENGRMDMRDDPMLREALYCIRCAACLNSCANFQTLGGHAYGGETYSGGIGAAWEAGTHGLETAKFGELCTGCSRCVPQCPVRIDIPWLNTVLRDRMNRSGDSEKFSFVYRGLLQSAPEDTTAPFQKQFFGNFATLARWGSRLAPLSNRLAATSPVKALLEKTVGLARDAELPQFATRTFAQEYKASRHDFNGSTPEVQKDAEVVLFPDIYVNYLHPSWGMAALGILNRLGIQTVVSDSFADGRAALSQGMVTTASDRAHELADGLKRYLDEERDIIVIEPSVLSMFRSDYGHLLNDEHLLTLFRERTFDPFEYLLNAANLTGRIQEMTADPGTISWPPRIFYHSHCQQRTSDAAEPTVKLLKSLGFEVKTSSVECCGMAGSFGYKREYYEVARQVGKDLAVQLEDAESEFGECLVAASGTSCTDQLKALTGRTVMHPLEILDSLLYTK